MGTARAAGAADVRQQSGMSLGDLEVIFLDRHSAENRGDEALAFLPSAPSRQLNPYLQLRNGYRRDRDVIAIVYRLGQRIAPALGVNQDRGVEDQSRQ
jgi:hypothetical protein